MGFFLKVNINLVAQSVQPILICCVAAFRGIEGKNTKDEVIQSPVSKTAELLLTTPTEYFALIPFTNIILV